MLMTAGLFCGKEYTVVAPPSSTPSRYQRQMALNGFGPAGQQRLQTAHVLLIGVGGLGSAAALYLAGAGIGTLTLADGDHVSLTNLHRQILYSENDIGLPKADVASQRLMARNTEITCLPHTARLEGASLTTAVAAADIVLDCTDNLATRRALNISCIATQTPWVHASVAELQGLLTVFAPPFRHGCYHCLFPDEPPAATNPLPILGPLPGIIGAMQALEAIRWLINHDSPLVDTLTLFDGLHQRWQRIERTAQSTCPVCGVSS